MIKNNLKVVKSDSKKEQELKEKNKALEAAISQIDQNYGKGSVMRLGQQQALDIEAFQQAWALASLRYPTLRTSFDWHSDILQVVTPGASIGLAAAPAMGSCWSGSLDSRHLPRPLHWSMHPQAARR